MARPIRINKVTKRGLECLWCKEGLSVLKRMGKADFCCREHEIRYYDEGQRLMLQQLIALRERLDALGRNDEAKHYPLTA